jgi:hypothetical protein
MIQRKSANVGMGVTANGKSNVKPLAKVIQSNAKLNAPILLFIKVIDKL